MMLNSKSNYKRLLLALVCGSMSYSTLAKVYSWRDADGAMHYSQFPRQIVEKNAAQSRASRKQVDMNDVVNTLSATPKVANLLDGLDDIIANANIERQIEKVLTRRDPQLILIEQQLARQQAEQQALLVANKQQIIEQQQRALAAVNNAEINRVDGKLRLAENNFMAGTHKRVYGHSNSKANFNNVFLAGIKRKVNRNQAVPEMDKPVILAIQNKARVASNIEPGQSLPAISEQVQNKFLAEINKKRFRVRLAVDNTGADNRETDSSVKNNELIQGAEQIKAIENEISNSRQSNKAKTPSAKQVNSALMLSRLSYHPQAHLPLLGAGINQLDIQGIDASSPFVNEVNRSAE